MPGPSGPADARKAPVKDADVRDELLADGTIVLFQPSSRQIITLNRAAALVWESCDGEHTTADIAAEFRSIFPDAANVERDVDAILDDLRARGVVRDAG